MLKIPITKVLLVNSSHGCLKKIVMLPLQDNEVPFSWCCPLSTGTVLYRLLNMEPREALQMQL